MERACALAVRTAHWRFARPACGRWPTAVWACAVGHVWVGGTPRGRLTAPLPTADAAVRPRPTCPLI
eukprot:3511793-Prymnesium_polylepis.1